MMILGHIDYEGYNDDIGPCIFVLSVCLFVFIHSNLWLSQVLPGGYQGRTLMF